MQSSIEKAIQILGHIVENQANTLLSHILDENNLDEKVNWIVKYCERKKRYLVCFWDGKTFSKKAWRIYSKHKHIYGPLIAYILAKITLEKGLMIGDIFKPLNGEISKILELKMGIFEFATILNYNSKMHLSKPRDLFDLNILKNFLQHYNDWILYSSEINHDHFPRDHKNIRNHNFPSEISENIVKFVLLKIYGIMPHWNTKKGDLVIVIGQTSTPIQLEVKGFMSNAPSSFGPKEDWHAIYFVDAQDHLNGNFKVYECRLSNKSPEFRNIVLSGFDFDDSCHEQLTFDDVKNKTVKELKEMCKNRCITQGGNQKKNIIDSLLNKAPGSKVSKPITFGEVVDANQRGRLRGSFEKVFQPQLGEDCTLIFDGNISELECGTTVNTNNLPPSRTDLLAKLKRKECENAEKDRVIAELRCRLGY